MKITPLAPWQFARTLLIDPVAIRKRLVLAPPWRQQLILALDAGWLFMTIILWLITNYLIARYDWPIYYPEFFRQSIWLNWGLDLTNNFSLLVSKTSWPFLIALFAGIVVQSIHEILIRIQEYVIWEPNAFILWIVFIPASIVGSLSITALPYIILVLLFWVVLLLGLSASMVDFKFADSEDDIALRSAPVVVFWLFTSLFAGRVWQWANLPFLEDYRWGCLGTGVVLFFSEVILIVPLSFLATKVMRLGNAILYYFYWISYFISPLVLAYYLHSFKDFTYPLLFILVIIISGLGLWLFLYYRVWSSVWVSIFLLFRRQHPLAVLQRDKLLAIPPYFSNSLLSQITHQDPKIALTMASYFLVEKKWSRLAFTLIQQVEQKSDQLDPETKLKLHVLKTNNI